MQKRHKKIQLRYIIITIIIIFIILIAILSKTIKNDRQENKAESFIKDTVFEIEGIVTYPVKKIIDITSNYAELVNIRKKYDKLKNSVEELNTIKAYNEELKKEIEELKDELNIDYVLTDYEKINTTVISRNTSYWYNTLTINKGKKSGIKNGMIVINSKGLIGKIVNVSNFTSDVRLITTSDTNNKISVIISHEQNKITGLINGYDIESASIEVEGVSNTENVQVGDIVYTSGLGGVYPSGILVGKVKKITVDSFGLAKTIYVEPSVDFDNINYVAILKRSDKK